MPATFPVTASFLYGSGVTRRQESIVQTADNQYETRLIRETTPRELFDLQWRGTQAEWNTLRAFFDARQGRVGAFYFFSPFINEAWTGLSCGTGYVTGTFTGVSNAADAVITVANTFANIADDVYVYITGVVDNASAYVTGDRTASITVTSDIMNGTLSGLVDGVTVTSDCWWNTNVLGKYVKFAYGAGVTKKLTEAKFYQTGAQTHGHWKFQGSNNDSDWTDIGAEFVLGGSTTQTITELSGNTTAYRYYRILGTQDESASGAPNLTEFEFKEAADGDLATALNGKLHKISEFTSAASFKIVTDTSACTNTWVSGGTATLCTFVMPGRQATGVTIYDAGAAKTVTTHYALVADAGLNEETVIQCATAWAPANGVAITADFTGRRRALCRFLNLDLKGSYQQRSLNGAAAPNMVTASLQLIEVKQ